MFNLDFGHIPALPGLPSIPAISPTGISDTTKSLIDKITTDPGSLFSNPMVNSVNFVGDGVTRLETTLTNISTGSFSSPSISQAEALAYLSTDPLQDIRTSMGNFMMHTDRLSGLLKSQGIQAPGLQQIMSIGVQMQNMMTLLEAGKGCLPVIGGATGLFSESSFTGYASTVENILSQVERGVATIADITDTIVGVSNLIKGIVSKDSLFLESCVNQLQQAAVAMGLEAINANPCGHFLLDTISNKNPGGVLDVLSKPLAKLSA